jgi:nucleoside-diphosphate-sugar epimerase
MRVFMTGASGWIGSVVVPELLGEGHEVVGLARSDASAAALTAAGVKVLRGTLDDLGVLRDAAADADGVVHLAFKHDLAFTGDFQSAAEADRRVAGAIGEALTGSDRPFLIAAGTAGLAPGRVVTERDGHDGDPAAAAEGPASRSATAELVLSLAERGVRSSVVRFAPTVHGEGDPGFMTHVVRVARDRGVSGHVGDGAQRWPAVHRFDAARLVRLALERAPAGSTVHAVAEEGVPLRSVAEVVGRHLGVPVASVAQEDAGAHFGWLAPLLSADIPASNALTRDLLDWRPTGPGLLDDLEQGHYFHAPPA